MKASHLILLILPLCLAVVGDAFGQQKETDTGYVNSNLQLANTNLDDQPDKGAKYAQDALARAEKIKDSGSAARALQLLGICYDNIGNLDSCLYFLGRSAILYQLLHNDEKLSNVISARANAYYVRGNFELALRNQLAALDLRKKVGNKSFVAKSLNNIGLIYRSKKDYANAINYYRQSLAIKEELNDEQGIINTLINISSAYNSKDQFDSTYYYANKGLQLAKKMNSEKDVYGSQINMVAALIGEGKFDEAEPLIHEVEQKALMHKDKSVLMTTYEAMGDVYFNRKDFADAEKYFIKGLAMAKSIQRKEIIRVFYSKLARCDRQLRKYDAAFAYADSAETLNHELLNEQNLRQLNEMAAVYESNEKEKHIVELNAQNALATAEASHRKGERNYFIIASILFLALAVLAYVAFVSNKKQKEEKEVLLKEIHHRVKNNLQVVSSLLSLQSNYIRDEQALEAVKDSRNRVQSMALIHQNLYQEKDLTGIDIRDYISKLCDNLFHSYNIRAGKIQLIKELEPMNLDVDIVVPLGLILNELITNSLKYAFPDGRGGTIKVILKEEPDKLKLGVYDNGVGSVPLERLKEEQTFGYKMIKAFLQKLKGEMTVYPEDGTRVDIEIRNYRSLPA